MNEWGGSHSRSGDRQNGSGPLAWGMFFALWNIILTVIVIVQFNDYHFVDPALYEAAKKPDSKDALHVAVELGRLDLVTMLLGIITLLIGIIAVSGFWMIRAAAINAAKEAANKVAKETAEIEATKVSEAVTSAFLVGKVPEMLAAMLRSNEPAEANVSPDPGLTEQQVQEVTQHATEMGPAHNG